MQIINFPGDYKVITGWVAVTCFFREVDDCKPYRVWVMFTTDAPPRKVQNGLDVSWAGERMECLPQFLVDALEVETMDESFPPRWIQIAIKI